VVHSTVASVLLRRRQLPANLLGQVNNPFHSLIWGAPYRSAVLAVLSASVL
jgi:hypothetical protein